MFSTRLPNEGCNAERNPAFGKSPRGVRISISLAEELVQARDKGAIAAFLPSGLSLNGAANLYHQALLEELFNGGHRRLGDALLDAQQA